MTLLHWLASGDPLSLLMRCPSILYCLKVDTEKYFCAKRSKDVKKIKINGSQDVETGFDSLGSLSTPCLCVAQILPLVLKAALCVAAVHLGGRY